MELGYIHLNKTEQVKQILALRRAEQGAIDELGIGSIRDAFADILFPGTSTLHQHAKYFALMPQIYQRVYEQARKDSDIQLRDVQQMIIDEEIKMTKFLSANTQNVSGITGADSLKNHNTFVKYDPTYIYNSALRTYGFIHIGDGNSIAKAIWHAAKQWQNLPEKHKNESDEMADDAQEAADVKPFCEFPRNLGYKFPSECSLNVNVVEREYILSHILATPRCQNTLLKYILEHDQLHLVEHFEELVRLDLPEHLKDIVRRANEVSDFIFMLFVQYNILLSNGNDKKAISDWDRLYQGFLVNKPDIKADLDILHVSPYSVLSGSIRFVIDTYQLLLDNNFDKLRERMFQREASIKQGRRKLGNENYTYSGQIHYYKLTYRWETVRLMVEELRKEELYG